MVNIHSINNLDCSKGHVDDKTKELSIKIAKLVKENMIYENNNTYTNEEMEKLRHNKTAESMLDLISRSYVIYLTNEKDELVGCGMVTKQDGRYFAKTLHIRYDYRGLGYAQKICDLREEFLKTIGKNEIYIESLKYPKTVLFHKKRGFKEMPSYRKLKYTILMRKEI